MLEYGGPVVQLSRVALTCTYVAQAGVAYNHELCALLLCEVLAATYNTHVWVGLKAVVSLAGQLLPVSCS